MTSVQEDRIKLSADGEVQLFRIDLRNNGGVLRFKADNDVTWQGNLYEGSAVQMSGYKRTADEEVSRPTLTMANPAGILTAHAQSGRLERSIVTRYKVLYQNLVNNLNIFEQDTWYISRVVAITKVSIVVELRNPVDGPNFVTPARMYIPPEFPAVSLQ